MTRKDVLVHLNPYLDGSIQVLFYIYYPVKVFYRRHPELQEEREATLGRFVT